MTDMRLEEIEGYLDNVKSHLHRDEIIVIQVTNSLDSLKREAVQSGNQDVAKYIWCLETILTIQRQYVEAFQGMQTGQFYSAWGLLERVEIEIDALISHFDWNKNKNRYQLDFIDKHTLKYQSLYPYKYFISPAMLIKEACCSICGQRITLHSDCGHRIGEIYDGEMCAREITKADVLEMSIVTQPVQKYSVLFISDPKTGETVDQYNYSLVKYAARGTRSPFDRWDVEFTTILRPHSEFKDVGRNDLCPCQSGEKYKRCCLGKEGVETPHANFYFSNPPDDLPGFVPAN